MKPSIFSLTFSIFIFITLNANAQTPAWQWSSSFGGLLNDQSTSIANDAFGNIYVVGSFYSTTITFGSYTLVNHDNSGLTQDVFIVKFDSIGNVVWAQGFGGSLRDEADCVVIDLLGNIVISGKFNSPSFIFGADTLNSIGYFNLFFAKIDGGGNPLWAKSIDCDSFSWVHPITTDLQNNIYVSGSFFSSTLIIGANTLVNTGGADMFIAKFDSSGNVLWAKQSNGSGLELSYSLSTNSMGQVYLGGQLQNGNSASFDTITLASNGNISTFLVKYDSNGDVLWAKGSSGVGLAGSMYGSIDESGNPILTGYYFQGSILFDTVALPTSAGGADVFIVKYNESGNVIWAKKASGVNDESGYGIATDDNNNIYVTGSFRSTKIDFDQITLTTSGFDDLFIAKLDSNGNYIFAKKAGGTLQDLAYSIVYDKSGYLYLTGKYRSTSIPFNINLFNANNTTPSDDIFIAKLYSSGTVGLPEMNQFTPGISITQNHNLSVNFTEPQINTQVKILDITGKVIKNIAINGSTLNFDIHDIAKGIYIISFASSQFIISKKFVIN